MEKTGLDPFAGELSIFMILLVVSVVAIGLWMLADMYHIIIEKAGKISLLLVQRRLCVETFICLHT